MTSDVLSHEAPALPLEAAARLAAERFGLEGTLTALVSERDQNFRIRGGGGDWVLKIANAAERPAVIEFQTQALAHIKAVDPALPVPDVHPDRDGRSFSRIDVAGVTHLVHVLRWLPGTPIGHIGVSPALRRALGVVGARLGLALRGFFHAGAGRTLLWDLKHLPDLRRLLPGIGSAAHRAIASRAFDRFEALVVPGIARLRAQVIHNDCNRDNVIVSDDGKVITGIIDFGDMLHGPLVFDLAVTAAYQVLGVDDIVAAAADVVRGYAETNPLEPQELELLPTLIPSRLLASAVICDWRAREHPENREYILEDHDEVWQTLARFDEIKPDTMRAAFAGFSPAARGGRSLHDRRRAALSPALRLFYDEPLEIVRGEGPWLWDAGGRRYLDAYNNVAQVGHCHPKVVSALERQSRTLNTNTRYLHAGIVEYAERLARLLPGDLSVCLFVCTGSEANDLALAIARCHTGHSGAVVTDFAYHGNTIAVVQLSPEELPSERREDWIATVPAPDTWRGGADWGREVRKACDSLAYRGHGTAALFVDSVFASDGIYTPPAAEMQAACASVRAAGGLYVADEVQAGFARLAPDFFGFERYGLVPDIVTLGKPMGNGHPLAAVVTTPAIAESFARRHSYFNTFGGNPVSAAVGLAVLDAIFDENLVASAETVGRRLRDGLAKVAADVGIVGDVRGAGLFIGVELVDDRQRRTPLAGAARRLSNRMRELGVLAGYTGRQDHVLKLRPPLVLKDDEAELLLDVFREAVANL